MKVLAETEALDKAILALLRTKPEGLRASDITFYLTPNREAFRTVNQAHRARIVARRALELRAEGLIAYERSGRRWHFVERGSHG